MRIKSARAKQQGLTLIEVVVFIVVISIGLTLLVKSVGQNLNTSADPILRLKALEKGQALLDEILARQYDENTPTSGIPACDSNDGVACAGILADGDFDDVGDYNGYSDTSDSGYSLSTTVQFAGTELGLAASAAKRITVVVTTPDGKSLTLSAYKVNF
ncbi:MAG: prepilin-type N-terminal cleavage/methylation domain-containing protein [Marinagarivorans sp.]|nr:prepilin-type N-terminal cleavage/methylation domain-containing protein [Marinagarivorans sp.]